MVIDQNTQTIGMLRWLLIAIFVVPNALPGEPIFWGAILIVLLSLGGGALSVDNIIRMIARR